MSVCERCHENHAVEVHHINQQKYANDDGFIQTDDATFHKNHLANLMSICEKCHDHIHKHNIQLKRVKTTNGYEIIDDV